MKNIVKVMLALGVLGVMGVMGMIFTACNQQQDIMGNVKTEVNDRAESMIDSLKRVCDTNFDNALQSRVTAAIKANNQPAVKAKPSIKASSKPKTTPAKTATAPPPPPKPISKGGRKGVGKGGNVLKYQNTGAIKTVPVRPGANQTKPTNTGTSTTQPSGIKTRPGVKTRPGTKTKSGG